MSKPQPQIFDVPQSSKLTSHSCPNCGHHKLSIFYEIKNVPVHSCLMSTSKTQALDFPCEDVVLGFCHHCGFITNTVFDSRWSAYAPNYEDQQSFSPTFNRFATDLATRLIEKYNLKGKDIVEIGCSKGDFLLLLCELGQNNGVGIDPSVIPGRVESEAAQRVQFIQDYYSEKYRDYVGDFLCCRHTLEHIYPTFEFVNTVRQSIGDRTTPVFFEIPDTVRVLKEAAFEDIYYEHCSYFTPGSLARLFRSCDFNITDLYLDYDDQYLFIEAIPGSTSAPQHQRLEETVEQTSAYVEQFKQLITQKLDWWKTHLDQWHRQGDKVVVWGSGSKCVAFLTTLNTIDKVQYVVDINPHRHGKFIPGVGKEIKSPSFLKDDAPNRIIIMNGIYRNEIQKMLQEMNVECELIALGDELKDL